MTQTRDVVVGSPAPSSFPPQEEEGVRRVILAAAEDVAAAAAVGDDARSRSAHHRTTPMMRWDWEEAGLGRRQRRAGTISSRRRLFRSSSAIIAAALLSAFLVFAAWTATTTTLLMGGIVIISPLEEEQEEATTTTVRRREQLRSSTAAHAPEITPAVEFYDPLARRPRIPDQGHRRLKLMEFAHERAPDDLRKMHKGMRFPGTAGTGTAASASAFRDPRSTEERKAMPLDSKVYKLNPLVKPEGYPWHRWASPSSADGSSSYALDSTKYVNVLSRLGNGEDNLGTVTPNNYTVGGAKLTPDVIRLGGKVRPYIIRDGTVLRPDGRTGMFVTLVERAVEMAKTLVDESPRMKLLTEGEVPLVFDANDYPWCGDDLVPIFRLNAIKSMECKHSWPVMSLTYFQDVSNVQLAESPYQWDEYMSEWDVKYPWKSKWPKVVWRGRITGYTYPDGERPRQELVRYGRNHLDIMDIKPSTQRSKMDQDDFQKYKAILDIDGNAWSARLGKLLCYNSVVIKVEPEYVGYWEKEIKPWVHYIPAESDFSDLEKTVRYVIDPKNYAQMQKIVRNGQQFCRTKLTMEQYTVDVLWTLLAYAELLKGSPDFYDAWRRDPSAHRMSALKMAPWKARVVSTQQ